MTEFLLSILRHILLGNGGLFESASMHIELTVIYDNEEPQVTKFHVYNYHVFCHRTVDSSFTTNSEI